MSAAKKRPRKKSVPKRATDAPPWVRDFWDTNAHSILILEHYLRDATSPGEQHAMKRVLRIMRAIDEAQ